MSLVSKILGMAGLAGKWLYEHYIDQTKIDLGFEQASAWKLPAIPVFKTRENGGRFKFLISTLSKHEIEISCLEIMFKSPLQLLNPGNDSFFKVKAANDDRFIFMLKWEGKKKVDQYTKIIFGIDANFSDHLDSHQVEFRVHAKRKNIGFGRFLNEGRTQVTIARQAFQLTSIPVQGIRLKPLEKFNVVQPFLAQQAWTGERESRGQLKFGVHEVYVDGSTSSRTVIGPFSTDP